MKSVNSLEKMLKIIDSVKTNKKGCKIWPFGISTDLYGQYSIKNKYHIVSRLLYMTKNPGDYEGLFIRHKCGIRSCCNIDHLEVSDRRIKGRDLDMGKALRKLECNTNETN